MTRRVLGMTRRLLGITRRVLGITRRVLGITRRVLGMTRLRDGGYRLAARAAVAVLGNVCAMALSPAWLHQMAGGLPIAGSSTKST